MFNEAFHQVRRKLYRAEVLFDVLFEIIRANLNKITDSRVIKQIKSTINDTTRQKRVLRETAKIADESQTDTIFYRFLNILYSRTNSRMQMQEGEDFNIFPHLSEFTPIIISTAILFNALVRGYFFKHLDSKLRKCLADNSSYRDSAEEDVNGIGHTAKTCNMYDYIGEIE
ncbi:MAG: hypothetical protein GY821_06975 [Gammaproteobacteria bacterium]|nr:hypothetical protein [Gammaproteobacteria bacterium]